jgi:hypothetical protein
MVRGPIELGHVQGFEALLDRQGSVRQGVHQQLLRSEGKEGREEDLGLVQDGF